MELDKFNIEEKKEKAIIAISDLAISYTCIVELLNIYALKQEKSIVQIQNKIALSQYLPTNSTMFLRNEKQKREKIKTPDNWSDAFKLIKLFFIKYFPNAEISITNSDESEMMKIVCNSFYATKIQYFTEIKLLCDKLDINYNNVKELILKNGWINPMHTTIPGHDGKLSFGGACFPKDIRALNEVFKKYDVDNEVLQAVIDENTIMRDDI